MSRERTSTAFPVPGGASLVRGCALALVVWFAAGGIFVRAQARQPALRTTLEVTNLAQLRSLSPAEAAAGPRVQLQGRVTFSDPSWNLFFVGDGPLGASVNNRESSPNPPAGAWVAIDGQAVSGRNGPGIHATTVRVLPPGEPPFPVAKPMSATIEQLASGREDARWVEVSGVVRAVTRQADSWTIEIGKPMGSIFVRLMEREANPPRPDWDLVNALVRVTGVCAVAEDDHGRQAIEVLCVGRESLRIEAPSPLGLFEETLLPLEALPGIADSFEGAHRVRVRGQVTFLDAGNVVHIGNGQAGAGVHPVDGTAVQEGDEVEASGFLSLQNGESHLNHARIRRLGSGPKLIPRRVAEGVPMGGAHLANLIRLEGRLVVHDVIGGRHMLTMMRPEVGEVFSVELRFDPAAAAVTTWVPGSRMEIDGIWKGLSPERGLAGALICRRAADLAVRSPPPWWTPWRLQLLVAAAAGFAVAAVFWAISLRRQIRLKSEQVRKQVAQELAVERRYRELFENATDTLLILETDSTVLDLNPAAERVFGRLGSELIGSRLAERLAHGSRPRFLEILAASRPPAADERFELVLLPVADAAAITLEISSCRRLARPGVVQVQIIAHDITTRKEAEAELAELNRQLLEASRRAGMAEVATSVLHNVGNVLNSVNVTTTLISEGVRESKISSLERVVALLDQHRDNLGGFLTTDSRGLQLPGYLRQLSEHLAAEQQSVIADLRSLTRNVEHIKGIVARQQSYGGAAGVLESVSLTQLVEDALALCQASGPAHQVQVVCELGAVPPFLIDKHKVLQILVNLVRNARQAVESSGILPGRVTIRTAYDGDGRVRVIISDNGVGIAAGDLTRIFAHGFTTKQGGHGFGLHASALAAWEMGGTLLAESEGPGFGAVFTLELPVTARAEAA